MQERTVTLGGSCRLRVVASKDLGPRFRLEVLRSVGKGLRIAGLSADVGLNITRSCEAASRSSSGTSVGSCVLESVGDGSLDDAVTLDLSLRLDTSPVATTSVPWVMSRLADLTPITGAVLSELQKIIGVLHSDVRLEYLSNSTDRERSQQPQAVEGYSSGETTGLPHTIAAPRILASGRLPFLHFAWAAPFSYPAVFNYVGELHRVDLGITESWSGNGTVEEPMTSTEVIFSGDGDHGLESRRQYAFRLRGVNANGMGAWSEWSSLVEEPRGVCLDAPAVPANFRRHSDPAVGGFIKIAWDAPANEDEAGGDYLGNVTYEVLGGPREAIALDLLDPAATAFNRSAGAGETWSFQVRAVNSAGKGSAWSPVLRLVSAATPGRPSLSVAEAEGNGTVSLSWTAPGSDGGSPLTWYELSNDTFISVLVQVPAATTAYDFEGQDIGRTNYSLRAVNAVGRGPEDWREVVVT